MLIKTIDSFNRPTIICLLTVRHIQNRSRDEGKPGCIVYFSDGTSITIATPYDEIESALEGHINRPRPKDTDDTANATGELPASREPQS